jgi:hypothetical protein
VFISAEKKGIDELDTERLNAAEKMARGSLKQFQV